MSIIPFANNYFLSSMFLRRLHSELLHAALRADPLIGFSLLCPKSEPKLIDPVLSNYREARKKKGISYEKRERLRLKTEKCI